MTEPRRRIGYAWCARSKADRRRNHTTLTRLKCDEVYLDEGLARRGGRANAGGGPPERARALDCCRPGDTLVVSLLSRLVQSVEDAVAVLTVLHERSIHLQVDGKSYGPTDIAALIPGLTQAAVLVDELLDLHTIAGVDASHRRVRPGRRYAKDEATRRLIVREYGTGLYTMTELGTKHAISRHTVSRYVHRGAGAGRRRRTS